MLKIFNNLSPFIEDNYKELGVREYAKLIKVSPPTASKILKELKKEGILKSRKDRQYIFYKANRESKILRELSIAYWRSKISTLTAYLSEETHHAKIVLFGSLSKLETTLNSDIDIFIESSEKKLNLNKFEKQFKRNIQLVFKKHLSNKNLKANIDKGVVL